MGRARYQQGSVVFDKRRRTWSFIWREDGKRKSRLIGPASKYTTKKSAQEAAESISTEVLKPHHHNKHPTVTVDEIITHYRSERMPKRYSTRRGYESWIRNYIMPHWGKRPITEVEPREVEIWLR